MPAGPTDMEGSRCARYRWAYQRPGGVWAHLQAVDKATGIADLGNLSYRWVRRALRATSVGRPHGWVSLLTLGDLEYIYIYVYI